MKCPFCSHQKSRVLESRDLEGGSVIRRRRECEQCKQRFTTHERLQQTALMVVKKDGRRELFDREKLITAFTKACAKRPISMERIESAVSQIESKLRSEGGSEVPYKRLGAMVMQLLRRMDAVAFVRFASVYQEFDDPKRFEEVLAVLSGEKTQQGSKPSIAHPDARSKSTAAPSSPSRPVGSKGSRQTRPDSSVGTPGKPDA